MSEEDAQETPEQDGIMAEASIWFGRMRGPEAEAHRSDFEAWLARGALHRAFYNRAGEIYAMGKFLRDEADGSGGNDTYSKRRPGVDGAGGGRIWLLSAAGIAFCLLLAGAALVVHLAYPDWQSATVVANRRADRQGAMALATGAGQILSQTLSDGSRVTLEANSSIRIAYGDRVRSLTLQRGKAQFEVAHETRPFVVWAGRGSVTARGTIFEVALLTSGRVSVHLTRGSIDVALKPTGRSNPEVRRLGAGEAVDFVTDGSGQRFVTGGPPIAVAATPTSFSPVPSADDAAWEEFSEAPLQTVVAASNRLGGVQIHLGSSDLAALKVSGRFRLDDPVRVAERSALALDLAVRRQDGGDIMLTRR